MTGTSSKSILEALFCGSSFTSTSLDHFPVIQIAHPIYQGEMIISLSFLTFLLPLTGWTFHFFLLGDHVSSTWKPKTQASNTLSCTVKVDDTNPTYWFIICDTYNIIAIYIHIILLTSRLQYILSWRVYTSRYHFIENSLIYCIYI